MCNALASTFFLVGTDLTGRGGYVIQSGPEMMQGEALLEADALASFDNVNFNAISVSDSATTVREEINQEKLKRDR
jgi:hypothetical protein